MPRPFSPPLTERQRSEQYFTWSQSRAHFLRHAKGLPQHRQTLVGRASLRTILANADLPRFSLSPDPTATRTTRFAKGQADASAVGRGPIVTGISMSAADCTILLRSFILASLPFGLALLGKGTRAFHEVRGFE